MADLSIQYRPAADLIPYARNSRTHSEAQIGQIAASIREFGWTNPILVDEEGTIIAGHGRLLAAQKLGLDAVPTIELAGLSKAQRQALIIADNKLALNAGWDDDLLKLELTELDDEGFDLGLMGFDEAELDDLFKPDPVEGLTDADEIPEPLAQPVSVPGDVWILGEHRLACGDCTTVEAADAVKVEETEMTLSDPPYGIGYEYEDHDDSDNEANGRLVAEAFALGPKVMVWTPGLNNLQRDLGRFGKTRMLIWNKRFAAAGNGLGGASTFEPILVVGHTPARKLSNDVLEVMTEREELNGESLRKFHSCPKPVALYQKLLEALTLDGQAVYEPFSGSGTTIIAGERSGRSIRAIEISPAYVDVAILRWQAFTGKNAVLEATGQSFTEILGQRQPEAVLKPAPAEKPKRKAKARAKVEA
jgi:hypothetical protein